jgi:hypothetical protein
VKKIFRRALSFVLSTVVGVTLACISSAFEYAADTSVLIILMLGFTGLACLAISYRRHRKKCKLLASEALRISQMPNASPMEWQKLQYQSKQGWKQSSKIWILLVGIFSWGANVIFSEVMGSDILTWAAQVSSVVSIMGFLILHYVEESREQAEFALSIEAANKGYWFPPAEPPKEKETAIVKFKNFVSDLPTELLKIAAKSTEKRLE